MSAVTLNCCQGLTIKKIDFGACCRRAEEDDQRTPTGNRVMMIHDTSLDLCVVSAPNRLLKTLGVPAGEVTVCSWDFMSVDKQHRLVMLAGNRFHELSGNQFAGGDADECMGVPIAEAFTKPVADILTPLVEMAQQGKSPQLHTIYRSQALTLFAYPMYNEHSDVIGVHIVYRPTKYAQAEIHNILTQNERASAASIAETTPCMDTSSV